jgi:hypothetical protein
VLDRTEQVADGLHLALLQEFLRRAPPQELMRCGQPEIRIGHNPLRFLTHVRRLIGPDILPVHTLSLSSPCGLGEQRDILVFICAKKIMLPRIRIPNTLFKSEAPPPGELRKLGIEEAKSTVEKYRVRPRTPLSPTWKTFLKNHVPDLVSLDFLTVPTVTYEVLFVLVILAHERHPRRVLQSYLGYYHQWRTHLSLMMDCPHPRPVQPLEVGKVMAVSEVGGLQHHDERRTAL